MQRTLLLLILLLTIPCYGQEAKETIELILAEIEDEYEAELMEERLTSWLHTPLDLNRATAEELSEVPYFDDFFIRNLLLERSRIGGFKSIFDLKHMQGAPIAKLPLLAPFLSVELQSYDTWQPPLEQSLYLGLEALLPQHPTTYQGVGWGVRYAGTKSGRHSWSVLAEGDRGETLLPLKQAGADYLSASYRYQADDWTFIAGDYRVTSGLGLLLGQGLSYFSRAELAGTAPSVARTIIKPHTSFREYGFLRGISGSSRVGDHIRLSLFYGVEPTDARIAGDQIITLYYTGMHRSKSEREHRHTALLHNGGGVISYSNKGLELGASLLLQGFRTADRQQLKAPSRFKKPEAQHTGTLYFQYLKGDWKLTGETLVERKERLASTLAVSHFTDLYGTFTLAGRYLGREQFTTYGHPDSYYTTAHNERGIQLIWRGELVQWWSGTLYFDLFQKLESERGISTKPSFVLTARADRIGRYSSFQSRLRIVKLAETPARATLRLAHQYRKHPQMTLRSGLNLVYSKDIPLTWGLFGRLQYGRADGFRAEAGLQYFQATTGVIRADQPWLPHRFYTPLLRGSGVRATAALRIPVTTNILLQSRANLTWYQEYPTSPTPSLVEASLIIRSL